MGFDVRTAHIDFVRQLAGWLGEPAEKLHVTANVVTPNGHETDAIVHTPQATWLIEIKAGSNRALIDSAIHHLRANRKGLSNTFPDARPLLLVPYMSEGGKQACAEAGISWADLSGNADISAPGLRIFVEGRKNQFIRSGRPSTLFAPKSARVAHYFLLNPGEDLSQRQIHEATGVDEGQLSRIVARMLDEGMVKRRKENRLVCLEPKRLLSAWRDEAQFDQHRIVAGHMTGAPEERLRRLIQQFRKYEYKCAATGLSAAWLYTGHAMHRLVTVYVRESSALALLPELGFREEPRGANTWIVIPKDEGVFLDLHDQNGLPCVDPIQTYIDLKGHPERAAEAAEDLYQHYFSF